MSAAFCFSTSACLARSSRSFDSASSAFSVQPAWISSRRVAARRISFTSAIDRAALARSSTRVSSISRMIVRIIRAGSSARSRSSVMLAAKMSRARLKTGPLNQVASCCVLLPEVIVSGSLTNRGVLTGTFASRISSSGIGRDCFGAGDLRRADRGADRDGAQQKRCCKSSERASELRLTGHLISPFCRTAPSVAGRCQIQFKSRANPRKLRKMAS